MSGSILFILRRPLKVDFEYAVLISNLLPIFEFQLKARVCPCVCAYMPAALHIDAER